VAILRDNYTLMENLSIFPEKLPSKLLQSNFRSKFAAKLKSDFDS